METKLKSGDLVQKDRYIIVNKIFSLDEFYNIISTNKIIYARHRIYPSAFFFSWQIRLVKIWIERGWFYSVIKKNK